MSNLKALNLGKSQKALEPSLKMMLRPSNNFI